MTNFHLSTRVALTILLITVASVLGVSASCGAVPGTPLAVGANNKGQLGDGTATDRYAPVKVNGLGPDFTSLAGGGLHSLALKSDGTVWSWGENVYEQLGTVGYQPRLSPAQVNQYSGKNHAASSSILMQSL